MSDGDLLQAMSDLFDKKLKPIENRLDSLDNRLDSLENRLDSIENSVKTLESTANEIERRVTLIELSLENETNKNLMIVAEGHLDLSRKLDTAINVSNTVQSKIEMNALMINKRESEIKKICRQLATV